MHRCILLGVLLLWFPLSRVAGEPPKFNPVVDQAKDDMAKKADEAKARMARDFERLRVEAAAIRAKLEAILDIDRGLGRPRPVPAPPPPNPAPAAVARARPKREVTLEELMQFYTDAKGRITTDWVDEPTAEKIWEAFRKGGYIPVCSEGRLVEGKPLYRHSYRYLTDAYPGAVSVRWFCYFGVKKDFYEAKNRDLQNTGFLLMQVMDFEDANGETLYCACWVNPKGVGEQEVRSEK